MIAVIVISATIEFVKAQIGKDTDSSGNSLAKPNDAKKTLTTTNHTSNSPWSSGGDNEMIETKHQVVLGEFSFNPKLDEALVFQEIFDETLTLEQVGQMLDDNDNVSEQQDHLYNLYCQKFLAQCLKMKKTISISTESVRIQVQKRFWNFFQIERDDKLSPYHIKFNNNRIDLVKYFKVVVDATAPTSIEFIEMLNCFLDKSSMYLNFDTQRSMIFVKMLFNGVLRLYKENDVVLCVRFLKKIPEPQLFFRNLLSEV